MSSGTSAALFSQLCEQRTEALFEIVRCLDQLQELYRRMGAIPQEERTQEHAAMLADAECLVVSAARELVRIDEAHRDASQELLSSRQPKRAS